jgi:nicotinamide N-methyltransferase
VDYTLTESEREQYREIGYFIRRGIIPPGQIAALKSAVQGLVECSAAGSGPELPWINREKLIPDRLGQLLRPGWIRPAFADSLVNGPYFCIAEQILGGPVRYCLFGMLASGDGKPYIQGWHRDLAPTQGEHQQEVLERVYRTYSQINAPLFPDRYLQIVPGSHLRPTTAAEREVLARDPTADMPGQLIVELEPGDVVFYYDNLLHRGCNPEGRRRWTMHHGFIRADHPVASFEWGQQEWIAQPGYLDSLPAGLRVYMQRYLDALPDGEPRNIAQP